MERAFNSAAARKLLIEGLLKKNPANEDIRMWTVEDFDEEPVNLKYSKESWLKNPLNKKLSLNNNFMYKNPLEEFRNLTDEQIAEKLYPPIIESDEKVEIIDPKDLQIKQDDVF